VVADANGRPPLPSLSLSLDGTGNLGTADGQTARRPDMQQLAGGRLGEKKEEDAEKRCGLGGTPRQGRLEVLTEVLPC
jgi:hypothetical protein